MKNKNVHPLQAIEKLNTAFAIYKSGNKEQAAFMCDELIKTYPKYIQPYNLLGVIMCDVHNWIVALDVFTKSLAVDPKNEVTLDYRGNVYVEIGQYELALADFTKALKVNPRFYKSVFNRGCTYQAMNKLDLAIQDYKKALQINPKSHEACNNLGAALINFHKFEEALALYTKALSFNPPIPQAYHNNKALILQQIGRIDEALIEYNKAIELDPNLADARFNRAMCLLTIGDKGGYTHAWDEYQWRYNKTSYPKQEFPKPQLLPDDCLNGKTLFIVGEQGIGDTLQFCRYAQLAKDAGAKVIVGVQKEVQTLLERMDCIDHVVVDNLEIPPFDFYSPIFNLPYIFKTEVDTIPNKPYFTADPKKVHEFSIKMGLKNNKLRVGLVWSGGFRPDQPEVWAVNERRNIKLSKLLPLKLDNVEFYSLQKGKEAEAELDNCLGWKDMINLTADIKDFADTAALIENLDLVIAVDTSTLHLAAGMGKPVFLLNRFDTCWRWFLDRSDSPWYPSVTIFRQPKLGDWDSVIQQAKEKLHEILSRRTT
jgi:tetratricopeptide (TPR) repeat protein